MLKDIKNKLVVVTGGANGIGFEIVHSFVQKGAQTVIILDVNEQEGQAAVKKLNIKFPNKAVFYRCDVTTDLEVIWKKLIDTYGYIDVLVNNAGTVNEKNPKKCIDVNTTALIEWSLKFWQQNKKDTSSGRGGTIFNVASMYGYKIDYFLPVYHATKFAVMAFTKSLGHEKNFKRSGVRVIALCPGFTYTNLTQDFPLFDDSIKQEVNEHLKEEIWQAVDVLGPAAVEVFEKAESGAAFLIEGGKPIEEIKVSTYSK